MAISLKGFPLRYAVYFIAAVYLFADLYACRGPLHRRLTRDREDVPGGGREGLYAAEVYGKPVTLLELEEAMRDHLWHRGEIWDALSPNARKTTRWLVLENLVNDRMLHAFRIMNGIDRLPPPVTVEEELATLARQFEQPGTFEQRLALQLQTPDTMREKIHDAILDEQWIEERIQHRLAEVTETKVRRWFDENPAALRVPEALRVAHIYLTTHDSQKPDRAAEVAEIEAALRAGDRTFEQLAAEKSEDLRTKQRGGDLGWVARARMPEDFMSAAEGLQVGQVSGAVQTRLGWHFLKLLDRRPPRAPEFAEVKDEILAMLVNERREQAVKSLVAELRVRSNRPPYFLRYHREVIDSAVPAAASP